MKKHPFIKKIEDWAGEIDSNLIEKIYRENKMEIDEMKILTNRFMTKIFFKYFLDKNMYKKKVRWQKCKTI